MKQKYPIPTFIPPTTIDTNIDPPSTATLFINQPQDIFDLFSTHLLKNEEQTSNPYNPTQELFTPNFNSNTTPTNNHPNTQPPSTASLFINQPQNTFDFLSPNFSKNDGHPSNPDNQNHQMVTANLNLNAPSPTTMRIVKNHYQLRDCPPTTSSTLSILPPELTTFHPKNIPNAPHNKHPNSQPTSTSSLFINKPQDTFSFFSSTSFSKNEAQSSNPNNPNQEMLTPNLNCNTPPTKKHPNIKSPSTASLFINQPQDIFDLFSTTNFSKNEEQPSNHYNPTQEQVTPNLKSNTPPTNKHPDIEPTSTASLFINQPQNTFEFFSTSFSKNEGYLSNHDNQNQQMFTLNLKRNALPTNNHPNSKKAPSSASLSPNNPQHSFDITPTLDIQNHETSHPNINPNAPFPPFHTIDINIDSPSAASLFINQPQDTFDFFATTNLSKNDEQPLSPYNPTQEQVTPNLNSNTAPTNKHPNMEPPSTAIYQPASKHL